MQARERRYGLLIASVVWALVSAFGCGGSSGGPSGPATSGTRQDGGSRDCVDDDDDGAGENCDVTDCDDEDPSITDECIRCRMPNEGCPCEVGTPPEFCMPPDIMRDGLVYECQEGTRYCREQTEGVMAWTDCQVIGMYTLKN